MSLSIYRSLKVMSPNLLFSYIRFKSCRLYRTCKDNNITNPFSANEPYFSKGTSGCASFHEKGSYTIEAAVVLPVFICFMVFALFFFRVFEVNAGVQQALDKTARMAAVVMDSETGNVANVSAVALCRYEIEKNGTPMSYVWGDINFLHSQLSGNYVDLIADYIIPFPIDMFGKKINFHMIQRARCRKWVGYDPSEKSPYAAEEDSEIVYVTEHGTVYHDSRHCSYLNPSIRLVKYAMVSAERNESGGIYYACPSCNSRVHGDTVYITDYGEHYHNSVTCSGLKRTIYEIEKENAVKRYGACSKCGI